MVVAVVVVVMIVVVVLVEVEQVEQVADRRHVARDVVVGVAVLVLLRVRQVVAAARRERGVELPVALDELHERRVLIVDVADVAAARERRDRDHRDARAGAEEVDRLDEAGVVVAATLVDGDEDRGILPHLRVRLGQVDDVAREGLEEVELRRGRVAVDGAIRLDVGHRRQRAVLEIDEQIGHVAHVIGPHRRIVGLILERIADVAVAVDRVARDRQIVAAAIILPRDVLGREHVADAADGLLRDDGAALRGAARRPRRIDVDGVVEGAGLAVRRQLVG